MKRDDLTDRFVQFANELYMTFPDLDLRFNLQCGTPRLRYFAPCTSTKIFQVDLNDNDLENLVRQAIFNVKELARRFDA